MLVVSEIRTATITITTVMPNRVLTPVVSEIHLPSSSARPVSLSIVPSTMPPPKRRIVPQSIRAAWFQLSVNFRRDQSSGRRKSSTAATIATVPSLAASLTWV